MSGKPHAIRKRGVRASRQRLYRALAAAGLKTQASLAERIAELEGLETAPKDVVNRVFRELPVEASTLERVARALGTEAYTLYRTADESAPDPGPPGDDAAPDAEGGSAVGADTSGTRANADADAAARRRWHPWPPIAAAVAAAAVAWLVAGWWPYTAQSDGDGASDVTEAALPGLALSPRPTLVILPLPGDHDGALAAALRTALGQDFQVASATAEVLTVELNPRQAADALRTDAAVDGELLTVGRFSALNLYLTTNGVRRQVWAESHPTVALPRRWPPMAERARQAVRQAYAPAPAPGVPPPHPPAAAQRDYLEGRMHLDAPASELNLKRAQARFQAALRQDARYARAHAGLCEALLEEHWMADEERALTDAADACGQASHWQPDDAVVQVAQAHYLRRTGRIDQALALYEQVLAREPDDADALSGLAATRLHVFRQRGDAGSLQAAMDAARAAADAEPSLWKPLFSLATLHYFAGDVDAAIAAGERALQRDANEYVLANLGTMYFCRGDLDQARDTYLSARQAAPHSYVGDEFLGRVHYFLGEHERALQLRRKAIAAVATGAPEIHEMWGALGDSLRQTGRRTEAARAYLKAATIAERDGLRGTATPADRAARAYYYTLLRQLQPARVPDTVARHLEAELDALLGLTSEPTASLRLALAWLHRGQAPKARVALERATQTCPVYARMPDVLQLQAAALKR